MKTMWLNTVPHSGTHTLLYLFSQLGGIDVLWDHFEARRKGAERATWMVKHGKEQRKDIVFVQAFRTYPSLLASYLKRQPVPNSVLQDNLRMQQMMIEDGYPVDFIFPIEAANESKTRMALRIFKACGVTPPHEAMRFMKTWPKLNEQGGAPHRGFPDKDVWSEFRPLLNKRMTKWMDE